MSSVYVTEPPTRGKVLLHTSFGDIDIELWPKEAPKACRNFVQLCLEGYYDDVIFHRIIKGLFVQTGDPTGTGKGGESIFGGFFPDEFHSRLKFSHRGQVACANLNVQDSNSSQFFITLEKCGWLDKKWVGRRRRCKGQISCLAGTAATFLGVSEKCGCGGSCHNTDGDDAVESQFFAGADTQSSAR
jgi:cyclophilin family peptidyl-prolyl cis-trans isomerase